MKNKLMVVAPYFYPKIGGMENYAWNISKGLKEKYGWDVVVVTSNHEEKKYKEEEINGLKIYRLPYWFKLSNTPISPMWYFQIKKIIEREKPDIINAHTPVPFISDIAARLAENKKIQFILTYQNDLIKENKILQFIINIYYLFLGNKTGEIAEKIVASSEYYPKISNYLKKFKNKIEIVPPGIEIKQYDEIVPSKSLIKKYIDKKVVLFVGQLDKTHKHKGLHILIDAVSKVKKTLPSVHLITIGRGDMINKYQGMAVNAGIRDNFEIISDADNKKLIEYYKISDTVVLPSTNQSEGFGIILIEASACKKPVIGSRIGGIPYIIDDGVNGILVEPKNPQSLADAILKTLSDDNLPQNIRERGYKKVVENFTWEKQVDKTENILRNI